MGLNVGTVAICRVVTKSLGLQVQSYLIFLSFAIQFSFTWAGSGHRVSRHMILLKTDDDGKADSGTCLNL